MAGSGLAAGQKTSGIPVNKGLFLCPDSSSWNHDVVGGGMSEGATRELVKARPDEARRKPKGHGWRERNDGGETAAYKAYAAYQENNRIRPGL